MSQSIMLLNQTHIHLPFKILESGRWLVGNSNTFSVEQFWEILSQVGHAAKQVQIGRNLSGHPVASPSPLLLNFCFLVIVAFYMSSGISTKGFSTFLAFNSCARQSLNVQSRTLCTYRSRCLRLKPASPPPRLLVQKVIRTFPI